MDQKSINRINELARKAKTVGLTPEEKEEQKNCSWPHDAILLDYITTDTSYHGSLGDVTQCTRNGATGTELLLQRHHELK